jgi:adenosylcobinamide amidohydrolase
MVPVVHNPELIPPESPAGPTLVWRVGDVYEAISSAAVAGGRCTPQWVVNIGVPPDYARSDLDQHASEVAEALDLRGIGIALFTSARLDFCRTAAVGGVQVDCTAGIGKPTFAASAESQPVEWTPGTINIVATLPRPLTEAAAVNAVITMTEAKTQALGDLGVPGTGTASDAVVVLWPSEGVPETFCGPRSDLGVPLANATYQAVRASSVATHPELS